ncbi:MAG: type II toxin-antitoxin system RelE/ParE family toxin [Nitrospirota bacterium]
MKTIVPAALLPRDLSISLPIIVSKSQGMMGRARTEFGRGYRSITFGSYVIFLRYTDEDGPRSHLYIVHIIHGARDLEAFFSQHGYKSNIDIDTSN